MSSALAAGLMGAAKGFLQGTYQNWQQDQQVQHYARLLRAKQQEQIVLANLQHQFRTQENVSRVTAQMQADLVRDKANNDARAGLEQQREAFEGTQKGLDRTAGEKRAQISADASLQAAKIRSETSREPRPRGDQIWQIPGGTNVLVKPGENPPTKGQLIWTNGGSVGARIRGGTPGIGSTLSTFGTQQQSPAPASTAGWSIQEVK